jgi:hypothetical protein
MAPARLTAGCSAPGVAQIDATFDVIASCPIPDGDERMVCYLVYYGTDPGGPSLNAADPVVIVQTLLLGPTVTVRFDGLPPATTCSAIVVPGGWISAERRRQQSFFREPSGTSSISERSFRSRYRKAAFQARLVAAEPCRNLLPLPNFLCRKRCFPSALRVGEGETRSSGRKRSMRFASRAWLNGVLRPDTAFRQAPRQPAGAGCRRRSGRAGERPSGRGLLTLPPFLV